MKEILRNFRRSLNLTQEEFAKSIDVKRGVIAQIEIGKNNPSFEVIQKIKDVYGVNLENFEGKNYNPNYNLKLQNETLVTKNEVEKIIKGNLNDFFHGQDFEVDNKDKRKFEIKENFLIINELYNKISDEIDYLRVLINILYKNGYKFTNSEIREMFFYEKVQVYIQDIKLERIVITYNEFNKIKEIVNLKIYYYIQLQIFRIKDVLNIDDLLDFEEMFQDEGKKNTSNEL